MKHGLTDSAHVREAMNKIAKRGGKRPRPSSRQADGSYRGESGDVVVLLSGEHCRRVSIWHGSARQKKSGAELFSFVAYSATNAINEMHRALDKATAREG